MSDEHTGKRDQLSIDLHSTTDASAWAREFCRMHGGDEGLMIGWFANAIMAGYDAKKPS